MELVADGLLPVVSMLLIEHRLLREMMQAMSDWLQRDVSPEALRERAVMLEVALKAHAAREEEQLFAPLRTRSAGARHLIEMMELVHEEVGSLFEEIQTEANPQSKLWTVLEMTEAHFVREENEVFTLIDLNGSTIVERATR